MPQEIKTHSIRISSSIANDVIRFVSVYRINAKWKKDEYDTHWVFTGSKNSIQRIDDFTTGYGFAKGDGLSNE